MKLLVCISKTPDTTAKIVFDNTGKKLIEEGIQYIMNPYDEWYALVRAIELKEQHGGTVEVIHVGDSGSEQIIRKALAIGADSAIRVDHIPQGSFDTAHQIAHYADNKAFDIIFLGKETIDHHGSEVGGMVAGLLNLPFVAYSNKLTVEGTKAIIESEMEGGVRVSEVSLPMVISCAKGMAEQRIPNMMGIMNAKKKPLEVITPVNSEILINLDHFELPPVKSSVKMISPDHIDEMIDVFKTELKII